MSNRGHVCRFTYTTKYSGGMERRTFLRLSARLVTGAFGAITLSGFHFGSSRREGASTSQPSGGSKSGLPGGPGDLNRGGVDESPARASNPEERVDSYEPRMTPIGDGVYTVFTYDRSGYLIGQKTIRPDRR